MFAGTGSDVGKSLMAAAVCRIMVQDGLRPAPFKAQNMALNSFVTPDGLEIGRAQAVQAEACRLAPTADMNPILLKPNTDHTTQVVLGGRPIGNRSAYSYFRKEGRGEMVQAVREAYTRLASAHNPIVMEGAGSISELNLRESDLVNLPMARWAGAKVVLVADIDRGGVFASCYGSIMLQSPEDRALIGGIIVNKFRGDMRLFDEGRRMLADVCQVPVLGVVPMFRDIHIDDEDSVALARKQTKASSAEEGKLRVGVVMLPHVSNFTDFAPLERNPHLHVFYSAEPRELALSDVLILPGTKSTLADLTWLREQGLEPVVRKAKRLIGICGGYQMLGLSIADPEGIEGNIKEVNGLGLLGITTVMRAQKHTRQVTFQRNGHTCKGYEIHQGASDAEEVIVSQGTVAGTYVHGLFDNPSLVEELIGVPCPAEATADQLDLLAAHVRQHVDIPQLYSLLQ